MKFFEDISGDVPELGPESDHRIVDDRPKRFLDIPLQEGQSLEEFIAENKKRMADAEANAPVAPSGPVLRQDEQPQNLGQYTDGWIEGATQARVQARQEDEAAIRASNGLDAAVVEGLHKEEYFKRVAGRGQKHSVDQAGLAQKDRQDLAGAGQTHSAAATAARAEDSMKRNAARPSTPSAGRSF